MRRAKKTFTELEIINFVKQISSALDYLEGKKIVHHDLRPKRIYLIGD